MRIPGGGARFARLAWATLAFWCAAYVIQPGEPATLLAADGSPTVHVQQGDGTVSSGRLLGIGTTEVRLADAAGGAVAVPVERVRTVRVAEAAADGDRRIILTLIDGSTLAGDEFTWDGKGPVELARPEGRVEIPAVRVRSVAVLADGGAAAGWQAAVPEGASSDLVVVGNAESHEFVECAITAVSPETVTVILDEETIPVKRAKVIGMQWLRTDGGGPQGRVAVAVAGGRLLGERVEWSADGMSVDGEIRLPASMFAGVDYAAGRTIGLAGLVVDKVAVEPWFGGLGRGGDGLDAFFAPREVAAASSQGPATPRSSLIMRPRTVATWRLPADSRRFRGVIAAAGGPQAVDPVAVAVAVDDRELFRRQIDGTTVGSAEDGKAAGEDGPVGVPVDVDVTGGRRLTVTVDFGSAGGIGGAILFRDAVVER